MDKSIISKFIGKTVRLWPRDTDGKVVKIIAVDDTGILVQGVKHEKCYDYWYKDGQVHFLAWNGSNIDFVPLENVII